MANDNGKTEYMRVSVDGFLEIRKKLDKGETSEEKPIYVCQFCGNTVEGEAPEKCPVCGVSKKMFKSID